jgi:hypothetical protein
LPSSDVYALGIVMWELFCGEKVFKELSDAAGQFVLAWMLYLACFEMEVQVSCGCDCGWVKGASKPWLSQSALPTAHTIIHGGHRACLCDLVQST